MRENTLEYYSHENMNDCVILLFAGRFCLQNLPNAARLVSRTALIEDELDQYTYFPAVAGHMENLGTIYHSKMAETSPDTGALSKGFITV